MRLKLVLLSLLLQVTLLATAQRNNFQISGQIGTLSQGTKVYFDYTDNGKLFADSAKIVNGKFRFSGKLDGIGTARMVLNRDGKGRDFEIYRKIGGDVVYFKFGNEDIMIRSVDSLHSAMFTGSKVYKAMQAFEKETGLTPQETDRIANLKWQNLTDEQRKDSVYFKRINDWVQNIRAARKNKLLNYAERHPDSYFSVQSLHESLNGYYVPFRKIDSLFNKLDKNVRSTYIAEQLRKDLTAHKTLLIGKPVPDFTQKDVNGKSVSLSDYRGKWVLVEFWASWCIPCRRESPNLLAQYKLYKDKGFEILAVSADKERDKWLDAIEKDGLQWKHVSDLKGWKNQVLSNFGISTLPANLLVDPKGILMGEKLQGEELNKKLKEIFDRDSLEDAGQLLKSFQNQETPKKIELLKAYLDKHRSRNSDAGPVDKMKFFIARDLAGLGKLREARDWVKDIDETAKQGIYSMLSAIALERKDTSAIALDMSLDAINMLKDKEGYTYALYSGTYAGLLVLSGRYAEALPYQEKAVLICDGQNPLMNELYTEILAHTDPGKAVIKLEDFIKKNLYTANMKALLQGLYENSHRSAREAGSDIRSLENSALAIKKMKLNAMQLDMPAPPFLLKDDKGNTVSLNSLKGKVVILDFWATWCKPCLASFSVMQKAVSKYKDNPNVVFLFVNTSENYRSSGERSKAVSGLLGRLGYQFNVLYDEELAKGTFQTAESYKVAGLPEKIVIDTKGRIRFKIAGSSTNEREVMQELELMIDLALANYVGPDDGKTTPYN